ncbi:methionyl-tRNA formyltransferase [Loktanella ponticola]|uniref:Methionyl-tRNA formyltransferase n=1 Tax=Yoonia ponticola TaxID=1524255 RepID=A0A7W9BJB5_9RHOB|nr:formyltransferase family protein [Yoonia ponticola]MBB5721277.1 methionyl-tRNA formyltransferase [Yoonia ponticola]
MTLARIILICHAAPFGKAMAAALHARFGQGLVGTLAIDRRPGRRATLLRNIKQAFKASALERRIRRVELDLENSAQKHFDTMAQPPMAWPDSVDIFTTSNPNETQALAWLRNLSPDLIIVTGAPILKPDLFDLPPLGTFNMHSSLLPDYRGTQAEFWQVLEDRMDTVGLTIHRVEKGVDTGAIVRQVPTSVDAPISPQMVRAKNLLAALNVVPDAVQSILDGSAQPKMQTDGGPPKRSKDKTVTQRSKLLARLGYSEFGDMA